MFDKEIEFSVHEDYFSLKEDYPIPTKLNIPEWYKKLEHTVENKTDFNIRKTYTLSLSNLHNSISNVHWFNLLHSYFNKNLKQYKFDVNILDYDYANIFNP